MMTKQKKDRLLLSLLNVLIGDILMENISVILKISRCIQNPTVAPSAINFGNLPSP